MKALVYTAPETLDYRDVPEPVRQSDDILVRIEAVGICGSDMHAYLGHDERRVAPLILGHEAAGTVVDGGLRDRRVVINPLVTCGRCPACVAGRTNICASRQIISMAPRQGAFADLVAIPERNLIPISDGMDVARAALAEPIATGWHAVTKAAAISDRPLAECDALVFGGGAVGMAAALSLHAQGCRRIHLAETNAGRRETVAKANIAAAYDPLSEPGPGASAVDVVIDCVGAKATRKAGIAAVRPGGVIAHVGLSDGADGMDVRKMTLQEVTFIGCYTYTMEDFRATVSAMQAGALGSLDWFEQRDLADGIAAFDDLIQGRIASSKIVLRPRGAD
ncbi:MAG: alcohol dehydrogenase catalytic domain-containing protein [Alphaproteobacteria bacterium]|nr:alcohol dehydrogenase catalytic domain-containing protein [Alphaproteobacteria bacterium]